MNARATPRTSSRSSLVPQPATAATDNTRQTLRRIDAGVRPARADPLPAECVEAVTRPGTRRSASATSPPLSRHAAWFGGGGAPPRGPRGLTGNPARRHAAPVATHGVAVSFVAV